MKVIGLIGVKRAGKTTAFNVIREMGKVEEITLARKLKLSISEVFNIPVKYFDDQALKEKELNDPVFLDADSIVKVFNLYGAEPEFDRHVRPHIGKVLSTPRKLAQYIGTDILRNYKDDIHCVEAIKAVEGEVGVVTDMRFPNEVEFFQKFSGKDFHTVFIHNIKAEVEAAKDPHASEAHVVSMGKRAEFKIDNNGTIKEFEDEVRKVIGGLIWKSS